MAPFLSNPPHVRLTFDPSHDDAVLELLGDSNLRFEVRGGNPIEHSPEGERKGPKTLVNFVRAMRHLVELPFAMQSADVQQALPDSTWKKASHQRVFSSWGRAAPQAKIDQYILWYDPAAKRLDKFQATGRFATPFAVAHVELEEHFDLNGFALPGRVVVRSGDERGDLIMRWDIELE